MRQLVTLPILLALGTSLGTQPSSQLTTPRIPPLMESQWTADIRALLTSFGRGGATNDCRTFAQHPALLKGVMPLATYVSRESTLAPRDRELLILRTAWLCRGEYVWAKHAAVAREAGVSAEEIRRVAEGPDARGWDSFEARLLRLADELYVNAFITDATWNALSARYDRLQMMDALMTVAEYTMLAAAMKTFAVQPDEGLTTRLPTEVPYGTAAGKLSEPQIRLSQPRIPPLDPSEWTPEVRTMVDPTNSGRPVSTLFQIYAQHQKQYPPRLILSEYLRLESTLLSSDPRAREMLILRTAWLCRAVYEWAAHERAARRLGMTDEELRGVIEGPDATMWESVDATVLRAADELHRDAMISDATWNMLGERYNTEQLMDVVITTGGYRLIAMVVNSLGVQLEPGARGFP